MKIKSLWKVLLVAVVLVVAGQAFRGGEEEEKMAAKNPRLFRVILPVTTPLRALTRTARDKPLPYPCGVRRALVG